MHQGEPCSPEGATAVTSDGVPMTCTTQKCHGAPFDSAALAAHRLLTGRSSQRADAPRFVTPAGAPTMPSRRSFCHRNRVPASAVATDWMTTRYMSWR